MRGLLFLCLLFVFLFGTLTQTAVAGCCDPGKGVVLRVPVLVGVAAADMGVVAVDKAVTVATEPAVRLVKVKPVRIVVKVVKEHQPVRMVLREVLERQPVRKVLGLLR